MITSRVMVTTGHWQLKAGNFRIIAAICPHPEAKRIELRRAKGFWARVGEADRDEQ